MRKRILGDLVAAVAAVAMLAALIFLGRMANRALGTRLDTGSPTITQAATHPPQTQPETTPPPPETTLETELPTEPETQPETQPETTAPMETEPERVTIDAVPQYFRNDYPDDRYDKGTIANSGSGMTALAMVASYLTDHPYYPDQVADDLADFCGNTVDRLEYGSELYQLAWRRVSNYYEAKKELQAGKVVIELVGERSAFTDSRHFIVWTGLTEEGNITVLDPEKNNYSRAELKQGYETGFRDGQLISGYSAAWVYDKSAMPEDPFLYESPPFAQECRYGDLALTDQELAQMARLICAEGASETFQGQQAIAEVILNRLAMEGFPTSIHNVIHAEGQFLGTQYMYKQEPTYTQYKAIQRALKGPYVLPKEVVFFSTGPVNDKVWGKIGKHTFCYSYNYQGELP